MWRRAFPFYLSVMLGACEVESDGFGRGVAPEGLSHRVSAFAQGACEVENDGFNRGVAPEGLSHRASAFAQGARERRERRAGRRPEGRISRR